MQYRAVQGSRHCPGKPSTTQGNWFSCFVLAAWPPQEFYETTLRALEKARNDRLWFKTQLKLVGLWFKAKEWGRMHRILKELHRSAHTVSTLYHGNSQPCAAIHSIPHPTLLHFIPWPLCIAHTHTLPPATFAGFQVAPPHPSFAPPHLPPPP